MLDINNKIVNGLKQDDHQVMKWLFDLYYTSLCSYANRYTNCTVTAEEVVSDVMLKIWQNRTSDYRSETFREYLFTATRNTALNYLKQQENRMSLLENWTSQLRNELIEETPLDKLLDIEIQNRYKKIIESLPEQSRIVFLLSREEDLSYEEIAARMGISVNTVKYHMKTALQKLRAGMNDLLIIICWLTMLK